MKKSSSSLSNEEKQQLKNSIFSSIDKHRRKTRLSVYLPLAACLTLVITYYFIFTQPSFDKFSHSLEQAQAVDVGTLENITLVLAEDEKITLEKDSVSIIHQGNHIQIQDRESIKKEANDKPTYNTLIVPYGKRSKITLSDGSLVVINSGSRFIYPSNFEGDNREVYLEGEAIFNVHEDTEHPFIVFSKKHEIKVLGTVFNVTNYPEDGQINTILKSGSVSISYETSGFLSRTKTLLLKPGMISSYNIQSESVSTQNVDVDPYFSWEQGVMIFENDPLEHIMKKLSRYYGCEIIIENNLLKQEKFSGYLDLKESVGKVLSNIRETTEFEFRYLQSDKVVIQ